LFFPQTVFSHPIASIFYLQRKIDGYGMFGFAHHPSTEKPPFLAFMLLYQYSGRGNEPTIPGGKPFGLQNKRKAYIISFLNFE